MAKIIKQGLVLILAMNIDKVIANLLKQRHVSQLTINPNGILALAVKLTTYNQVLLVLKLQTKIC